MVCLATAELRSAAAAGALRAATATALTRNFVTATLRAATASHTLRADEATAAVRCVALHDGTLVTELLEPVLLDNDLIAVN